MTPDSLRHCLATIRWSQQDLARALDMDERQVRRWAAGARIPPMIAIWLETLAAFHKAHPPPERD